MAAQRCNMSSFFYAKICSLLARRRSSQPVQRVYWPENVIDWLGKWRPTCVMQHARGQKLQSFRRKWPFYMYLYSMVVRQKVDLRRTFYFDTRIHPEVRGFINLFSICACSPIRYGTIRARWKTALSAAAAGHGLSNTKWPAV